MSPVASKGVGVGRITPNTKGEGGTLPSDPVPVAKPPEPKEGTDEPKKKK